MLPVVIFSDRKLLQDYINVSKHIYDGFQKLRRSHENK